jgi:hypothetical protein
VTTSTLSLVVIDTSVCLGQAVEFALKIILQNVETPTFSIGKMENARLKIGFQLLDLRDFKLN